MQVKRKHVMNSTNVNTYQNFQKDRNYTTNNSKKIHYNSTIDQDYTLQGVNAPFVQMKINEYKIVPAYTFLGARTIRNKDTAYFYQLPNGQKVVIAPKKGPTVVKTHVCVGSMNEPDKLRGISHYIEHNLFNGSKNISAGEFFHKTADMGAITNASTGFHRTDYFICSQLFEKEDLEEKIKMHADMIQNPIFDEAQLEKEQGPVISEISMMLDSPNNLSVNKCIKNLFNIQSSSQDIIGGTIENIKNITKQDVLDYYNTWYTPDNYVTVITGEVEPTETMRLVSKYFTSNKTPNYSNRKFEPLVPIQAPIRVDIHSPKTRKSLISLGFVGPAANTTTKEKLALNALFQLLNGDEMARINKSLETLNADASVSKEQISNNPNDPTAILINIVSSSNTTEQVLKNVYSEINKIANTLPSEEEMNYVKNSLKLALSEQFETSAALNQSLGDAVLNNDFNFLLNAEMALEQLSAADISIAARKYLDLNKASIAVVKPNQEMTQSVAFKGHNAKTLVDTSKVVEQKLNNNLEFLFMPEDDVKANVVIKYENKQNKQMLPGVDELLSKMLRNGTDRADRYTFYTTARNNNISLDFICAEGKIIARTNTLSNNLPLALAMVKENLEKPNLTEENFKRAQKNLINELTCTQKNAFNKMKKELFPGCAHGYTREEILEAVKKMNLDDVKRHYEKTLANAQADVVISAPKEQETQLTQILSTFPQAKTFDKNLIEEFTPLLQNKIVKEEQSNNQAHIIQAYKFKINKNPKDKITFDLMNMVLGGSSSSRLFQDLREKQKLAYAVSSNYVNVGDTGILMLSIKTTTDNPDEAVNKLDNLDKSLDGFKKHIELMKTTKCTEDELNKCKRLLKTHLLNASETARGRVTLLYGTKDSVYGIDGLNKVLDTIDSITPEEIQNAANYVFNSPSVISVLGSKKTLEQLDKYCSNS